MGTRGTMAFVLEGETKAQYVHNDSYPSGLGADILKWLRSGLDSAKTRNEIRALIVVNDSSGAPTDEQQAALSKYADTNVSRGSLDDWYCLLRECQGNPALTLEAGYVYGDHYTEPYRLGSGSEYVYVVNCDKRTFTASGYGHLLGRWSFDELPKKTAFLAQTEPEDED